MRGKGSTVFMATGFVNGNRWFTFPTNSTKVDQSWYM